MDHSKLYIYDLETLKNVFLFSGKFYGSSEIQTFEISSRINQRTELLSFLSYLQNCGAVMVGFNSLNFDYPIIHDLLMNVHTFGYERAAQLCQQIILSEYGKSPLGRIPQRERVIPQIDLVKINHFDSAAKRTSLKALQFAMRSPSVEDLPFPIDRDLTPEEINLLINYNHHDVTETEKFLTKCLHLIEMRQELLDSGVITGDVLNYNDVKIGEQYLVKKIGRAKCFAGSQPKQTQRESVRLKDVILPSVSFRTPPFQEVLDWFREQTFYMLAKVKPKLEVNLAGVDFVFGAGGVHASVSNRKFESNETHVIKDIDVTGMYVAVAVVNGFSPEHLGKDFSEAYRQLQKDRAQFKKGTTMNAVLKLAGNGVYGKSSDIWSCFYDPNYTFTVTCNGQLQLLQLVETLSLIPGLDIIQVNTDGITALVPRKLEHFFQLWKSDWESLTGLRLEEVEYTKMWIRDVNNYLAITSQGKIKRKGAYWYPENDRDYEGAWNKDFSAMIVQKVTEQVLINNWNPEVLLRLASDKFDFMMRYKTPSDAVVKLGDRECSKTVRYYVSTKGEKMVKHSKPKGFIGEYKRKNGLTDKEYFKIRAEINSWNAGGQIDKNRWDERIHTKNKSRYEEIETSIEAGWLVREVNNAEKFDWSDVNYDYYLKQVEKLLIGE